MLKPYLIRNGKILLLRSPIGKSKDQIVKKMREVSLIEGVQSIKAERIWMLAANSLVGSIILSIHEGADHRAIVQKAHEILSGLIENLNIEIYLDATKELDESKKKSNKLEVVTI